VELDKAGKTESSGLDPLLNTLMTVCARERDQRVCLVSGMLRGRGACGMPTLEGQHIEPSSGIAMLLECTTTACAHPQGRQATGFVVYCAPGPTGARPRQHGACSSHEQ